MGQGQDSSEKCGCCGGEFRLSNFGLNHLRPHLFVSSQWQLPFPIIYVLWRVLWSIFFLVWIVLSGVFVDRTSSREENHIKWFIYLTNWSFLLLNIYLLVHAIVTTVEYARKRKGYEAYSGMPWEFKMVWVLFNIAIGMSVTTSALYWGLLHGDDGQKLDDVNFMTHGLNSIYIILDILFVTGVPLRLYHVVYPFTSAFIYGIFTLIYDLADGTNALDKEYIYKVLDWSEDPGKAVLYFLLTVFVGLPVIWLVLFVLFRIRLLIFSWCCASREDHVV